jgi:hypothetical protein
MGEPRQVTWDFYEGEDTAPGVRDCAAAMRSYGMPWIERYSTLDGLFGYLDGKNGELYWERKPVVLGLMGMFKDAENFLDFILRDPRTRDNGPGTYGHHINRFVNQTRAWLHDQRNAR